MMTSYTSSAEENIPYLRKFAQNNRNNNVTIVIIMEGWKID